MPALTTQIVADVMRHRLGLPDNSQAARFINLIPEALKRTGRKVAADPFLRSMLVTNPAVLQPSISAGSVPFSDSNIVGANVMIEYLDKGQIYHTDYPNRPLRRIHASSKAIMQPWADYGYYYTEGAAIWPIAKDGIALTGALSLAVPYYPGNLAALPTNEELQAVFFNKLEELLAEAPPDAAQDGEQ